MADPMKRWRVLVNVGTTVGVMVDAETEDEAIEAASEDMPSYLCAYCSGSGRDWFRDEWEPDWDKATAEEQT